MSDAAPLRVARDTAVATLVIDRPERRNAISLEMYEALPGLLGELDADPAVKVVVIRGAGRDAFAAGADMRDSYKETSLGGLAVNLPEC